ncbi:MAG: peptidyl-prolyl cis-trans isomerase [Planctomycetota bacterium]|nr:MAG: peptidyl-prolyl cis-trans isomerase [Planctomycetota bacterium]
MAENNVSNTPRVELEITQDTESWGKMVLELDAAKAPITAKNFLSYVDEGYYDGTIFHRVISDFMIQGGGFISMTKEKTAGLHEPIQNEAANGLKNRRGTIAMARTADPHSATSQFFINVADNAFLDYPGQDGWGYCVFGQLIEGLDVMHRIEDVETRKNPAMGGEQSLPLKPPMIKKAQCIKAD